MAIWIDGFAALFAFAAAAFAFFGFLHGWIAWRSNPIRAQIEQMLRAETDLVRAFGDEQARGLREELGKRLDGGIQAIGERAAGIGTKLDQEIARMGLEANQNRDTLRQTIESALQNYGTHQKERLDGVMAALAGLTEKQERALEALRLSVEGRLDAIRVESAGKLEEMRKTVDEKLQATLEARLDNSFSRVIEQLERVHKGIGEVQSLAAGVGDLKKVLSNVRVRGTFGEIQLGALLDQFLAVEQIVRNAWIKEGSQERVEFAIRLPGAENELLLPIDSKFPHEDYLRLVAASEVGDAEGVAEAGKAMEARIKVCARTISEKYICPPRTTNFAILFLPTESLYAEVLRRPGLFEEVQRDYQVTLTGPTTLTALLNALQMGFRTLAIEKRSSEVWQILGAVRNEFGAYNQVVNTLSSQLNTVLNSVNRLGTRTRAMNRKLVGVEKLTDDAARLVLPELDRTDEAESEAAELPDEPARLVGE